MTPYSVNDRGQLERVEIFGRSMLNGALRYAPDKRWICVHPMMRNMDHAEDCPHVATHVGQNGTDDDRSYHIPLCVRHAAGWTISSLLTARIPDLINAGVRRLVWK